MTADLELAPAGPRAPERIATVRHYLMCPPTHFDVTYTINPWMQPGTEVDRARALAQWQNLRATYEWLGHQVSVIEPGRHLPDMVFAANGGLVVDGRALGSRFRYEERVPEADRYNAWFSGAGFELRTPSHVNEGEGDFLLAPTADGGEVLLAGTGFRTEPAAHVEAAGFLRREVVSLGLVDPRFYHLDTAMVVLDERTAAFLPEAFDLAARRELIARFPDLIPVSSAEAGRLGLNAVCDGRHVLMQAGAEDFCAELAARGFVPVPVDVSEMLKAGGAVKCCTLELRGARS